MDGNRYFVILRVFNFSLLLVSVAVFAANRSDPSELKREPIFLEDKFGSDPSQVEAAIRFRDQNILTRRDQGSPTSKSNTGIIQDLQPPTTIYDANTTVINVEKPNRLSPVGSYLKANGSNQIVVKVQQFSDSDVYETFSCSTIKQRSNQHKLFNVTSRNANADEVRIRKNHTIGTEEIHSSSNLDAVVPRNIGWASKATCQFWGHPFITKNLRARSMIEETATGIWNIDQEAMEVTQVNVQSFVSSASLDSGERSCENKWIPVYEQSRLCSDFLREFRNRKWEFSIKYGLRNQTSSNSSERCPAVYPFRFAAIVAEIVLAALLVIRMKHRKDKFREVHRKLTNIRNTPCNCHPYKRIKFHPIPLTSVPLFVFLVVIIVSSVCDGRTVTTHLIKANDSTLEQSFESSNKKRNTTSFQKRNCTDVMFFLGQCKYATDTFGTSNSASKFDGGDQQRVFQSESSFGSTFTPVSSTTTALPSLNNSIKTLPIQPDNTDYYVTIISVFLVLLSVVISLLLFIIRVLLKNGIKILPCAGANDEHLSRTGIAEQEIAEQEKKGLIKTTEMDEASV